MPGAVPAATEVDWGAMAEMEPLTPAAARQEPTPEALARQGAQPSHAATTQATTTTPPIEPAAPQQPPIAATAKVDPQPPQPTALDIVNSPEWQKDALTKLEAAYQLSEEEAEAYLDDPIKALPKLMAKAHLRLAFQFTHMQNVTFENMLVPVINHQIGVNQKRQEGLKEAEVIVFKPYPKLREVPEEVMSGVVNQIKATTQPGATKEQVLRRVAVAAYAMMGWPMPNEATPAPQQTTAKGLPPINPPAAGTVAASGGAPRSEPDANGVDWAEYAER